MLRVPRPLGMLLIALLLATVFVPTLPATAYWQRVLQDAGHGVVFAAVAIVLLAMRPPGATSERRSARDYGRALAVAVALGIATEWLQVYLPARHVSLLDALHDAVGAVLGLAIVALAERRGTAPGPATAYAATIALAALVALAWEPLRCARVYAERARSYPTLAPMGRLADAQFVAGRNATVSHASLPAAWRRPGDGPALRLSYQPGARSALELTEAAPDWRNHRVLALDVTNPAGQPASFILRVLDRGHDWSHEDRLNLPVIIPAATRTTVRISMAAIADAPAGRAMDLSAIANVMLFATRPLPGEALYVSRIWLED
jgi:hypothetical protein